MGNAERGWLMQSTSMLGLLMLAGCLSVNQDGSAASGGAFASGGSSATGGLTATGGVSGSGGVVTGGVTSGGTISSGGVPTTGGLMNTGGCWDGPEPTGSGGFAVNYCTSGGVLASGGVAQSGGVEQTGGAMATCQPLEYFDLSCQVDTDCIAVGLPGCCTGEYIGAPPELEAALEENQWLCDPSPALCDCGYVLGRTQDGTYVGYGDEVRAYCDAGTCRTSAVTHRTCGSDACAADTYCHIDLPGAAGSEPSYACPPLPASCTDCACLEAHAWVGAPCECQDTDDGPTVTCAYP